MSKFHQPIQEVAFSEMF